jgi:hypothetical protein
MGEDGEDGEGGDADMNGHDGREPGPVLEGDAPTFHQEIVEAVDYERSLSYRELIAAGLVVVVVVIRALFFT